jgi:hypothetical protein
MYDEGLERSIVTHIYDVIRDTLIRFIRFENLNFRLIRLLNISALLTALNNYLVPGSY